MNRIKEPSTWAGIGVLLQALKVFAPQYAVIVDALTAVAGSVAVTMRERGGGQPPGGFGAG